MRTMAGRWLEASGGGVAVQGIDAYTNMVRTQLDIYLAWLSTYSVKGYIGEYAWPHNRDSAQWNAVAEAWYTRIDGSGADIWATAWETTEHYPFYQLNHYTGSASQTTAEPLSRANANATPLETHLTLGTQKRGVCLGDDGVGGFALSGNGATWTASNAREVSGYTYGLNQALTLPVPIPDTYNSGIGAPGWSYGAPATYTYLASRGHKIVRLAFRWERVQRTLGGTLDATELGRIDTAITAAGSAGLEIILDVHNFGIYYLDDGSQGVRQTLGGTTLTDAHFADLWSRLATYYTANSTVVGYGLMNEPAFAVNWSTSSQAAVDAIRATGDTRCICVSTPNWADIPHLIAPWITSGGDIRYEMHHYWDYAPPSGASGAFPNTYDGELTYALSQGYTALETPTVPHQVPALTVTVGTYQSARLAWDSPMNGGAQITDYLIEYSVTGSGSWSTFSHTADITGLMTVTGLTDNTSYDFRVSAVNSVGTGPASETVTATVSTLLPVSGLKLWLRAGDIDGLDGDTVSTWADVSGYANDFSLPAGYSPIATYSPVLKTVIVNGLPVVRFDGTNDFLNSESTFDLSGTSGMTVFVVMSASAGADEAIMEMSGNMNAQTDSFLFWRPSTNKVEGLARGVGGIYAGFDSTRTLTTTPRIAVYVHDRSLSTNEATVYVDGDSGGTHTYNSDLSGNFGNRTLYLGARSGSSLFLTGDIAEVGIFTHALSAGELSTLHSYLGTKYGITIG